MIRNCCLMLTLNGFLFGNQEMQDNSRESSLHYLKEFFRIKDNGDANELQRYLENPEVQKDTDIQTITGLLYYDGSILEQSYEKAIACLEKAAINGSPKAQEMLACIYFDGEGIGKDVEKGVYWLDKALAQNYTPALSVQALRYYLGEGVGQSYQKAFELYEKGALLGDEMAQYHVGAMYIKGEGVEKDFTKAFHWMKKSADAGNDEARYELFVMYHNGEGTKKDIQQALYYLQLASENGLDKAQCALGEFLESQGLHKEAMEFFEKAAAQGNEKAKKKLELAANKKKMEEREKEGGNAISMEDTISRLGNAIYTFASGKIQCMSNIDSQGHTFVLIRSLDTNTTCDLLEIISPLKGKKNSCFIAKVIMRVKVDTKICKSWTEVQEVYIPIRPLQVKTNQLFGNKIYESGEITVFKRS